MSQAPDVPDVMLLRSEPPGPPWGLAGPTGLPGPSGPTGPGPRTPLIVGLTLLAISVALVLFFTLCRDSRGRGGRGRRAAAVEAS